MRSKEHLSLTSVERDALQAQLRRRNLPVSVARRIQIVLMLDEGASYAEIKQRLDTTAPTISLWKRRFRVNGLLGLTTVYPGQAARKLTPKLRQQILAQTQQAPPAGSLRWSLRSMAAVMGVGKDLIRQVWREADLKPSAADRSISQVLPRNRRL